jgi:hypothetical protein
VKQAASLQIGSGLFCAFVLCAVFCSPIAAQETTKSPARGSKTQDAKVEESKAETPKVPRKPAFTLRVKTKPILNLSLKAEKAKLVDVSEELSKRLKVRVFLGPTMEKQLISVEFIELTLEPAVQLLAPAVYIDYEVNMATGAPPQPIGIFLYADNQSEPPANVVVPGNTQSLLIEGDTEEGVEPESAEDKKKQEEQPLRILFEKDHLSVKAKQQPLSLVLLKIGEELGIPVDIQYASTEMVTIEINKLPVEDVIRRLSPNILLFVRADLQHSERRALRLVLYDPAKMIPGEF